VLFAVVAKGGLLLLHTAVNDVTSLQVTREELEAAATCVGKFGTDNRAGIPGTLHRISALRSRKGSVVGLTCRVGRAVSGNVGIIQDVLAGEVGVWWRVVQRSLKAGASGGMTDLGS